MALFLGFDQSHALQGQHILFDPFNLVACHATALDINGDAREMRGSCVSDFRSSVAIMPPQFALHLHGANRRVDLDLGMKALVVILAQVVEEVTGPRPAIAAIGCGKK